MKKSVLFSLLVVFFFLDSMAFAGGTMGSQGMKKRHSGYMGNLIQEMDIDEYPLSYRLIDLQAQIKNMELDRNCSVLFLNLN